MESIEEISKLRRKAMLQTMIEPENEELVALGVCSDIIAFMATYKITYKVAMRITELLMLSTCTEFIEEEGKIIMKLARFGQDKPPKLDS